MGNKKTEAKKRNRQNRRLRAMNGGELLRPKTQEEIDEEIHEYAMQEQGFDDFLDCGDK